MVCNDLDDESAEWLLSWLGPEPSRPVMEPVTVATPTPTVDSTFVLRERDEAKSFVSCDDGSRRAPLGGAL